MAQCGLGLNIRGTSPHITSQTSTDPTVNYICPTSHPTQHKRSSMIEVAAHQVTLGTLVVDLPLRRVAPGVRVALFNPLGNWKLVEAVGKELAKLVPAETEVLIMPSGKAEAILHVVGRERNLPTIVARKERKPYMGNVVWVSVTSITTGKEQSLFLSEEDAIKITEKKVVIIDDVVSTGSTLDGMIHLLEKVQGIHHATVAVLTEGENPPRGVLALAHVPLFLG